MLGGGNHANLGVPLMDIDLVKEADIGTPLADRYDQ